MLGRDNTIVPQSCRSKGSLTLVLNSAPKLWIRLADCGHDGGELFGAHDGGLCVGPGEEETRGVCAATVTPLVLVLGALQSVWFEKHAAADGDDTNR